MSWLISLAVSKDAVPFFTDTIEPYCQALSCFEQPEDITIWTIQGIAETEPNQADLNSRIALQAAAQNMPCPKLTAEKIKPVNWVAESQRGFPPMTIGGFYVHGTHVTEDMPPDLIGIEINAATAFGTGEHATTKGCLMALDQLKNHTFDKPLDLGCGTGILAIAMAKLWGKTVIAADNDPEAVTVTGDNAALNHVQDLVIPTLSEGFADLNGPFDIITANILAKPLCDMAADMATNIKPGGYLILSGILDTQAENVLTAYKDNDFVLEYQENLEEWVVLTFRK